MKRGNRNNIYERGGQVSLAKAMGNVAKKGDKEINDGREEIKSIRKDITSSENQINNLNSKEKEIEKVIIDKKNEINEIKDDLGEIYKTVQDAKKQKAKFAKGGEIVEIPYEKALKIFEQGEIDVYGVDENGKELVIEYKEDFNEFEMFIIKPKFAKGGEIEDSYVWVEKDNIMDVEDFEEDGEVEFGSYKDMMESLDEFNEQVETNYSTIKEFNDGEEYRRIMTIKEFEEYKKDWLKDEGYAKGGETISREDIVEVLKDELEDVLEDANQEYEGQDIEGEEVEYKSRDGFIPYTDGGYEYRFFTYGNYLTGSGKSLPTNTLDGELERQEELNLEYGKERFEEEFADIVKELGGIENVDYSSLQDAGYMDEAEDLDEFSRSDDDSIMFEVEAFYYNPDNDKGIDGKHTIVLTGNVNMEAPYHRTGNYEDYTQDKFTFDSIEDLKEKLQKGIDKISKWFNGDNYKEGRELKMGRFEKGGFIEDKEFNIELKKGKVFEFNEDEEGYSAKVGYQEFYGQKYYYIYFNGAMVHSSKTFKPMLRKLNQLKADYNLEFAGEEEFAKGGIVTRARALAKKDGKDLDKVSDKEYMKYRMIAQEEVLGGKNYAKGGKVKTSDGSFLWFFNWNEGGFNQVYAKTKAQAIKKATENGYPSYMPDNQYSIKTSLQDVKEKYGKKAVDYIINEVSTNGNWSNNDQKRYYPKLTLKSVGFSSGLTPNKSTFRKQSAEDSRRTDEMANRMTMEKGGEVKKKENNEMLIGGIAGILLGIFLGRR